MHRITALTAGALIAVVGFIATASHGEVTRKPTPRPTASADPATAKPSGLYASAESNLRIAVRPDGIGEVESTAGWGAVGFFVGREFTGLMRDLDEFGNPTENTEYGSLRFTLRDDGSIDAVLAPRGGSLRQDEHWRPRPKEVIAPPKRPEASVSPPSAEEPKPGDYVYVEELPETITRVQPTYPAAMRESGIDGDVVVKALVGKDGRVSRTLIVKSIREELDAAAAEAVRQWIWKPARSKAVPVAVWVDVPIRFSLH